MGRRALDVFLYAPVGLVVTAAEELPALIEKGRARVEVPLRNARFLGKFAVTGAQRDLLRRLDRLVDLRTPGAGRAAAGRGAAAPEPPPARDVARPGAARWREPLAPASTPDRPADASLSGPSPAGGASPVDMAIPGYDALSASQVVRRLEGLGPDELHAVHRYEASTRNRRTILHRCQQLLGMEEPPGAPAPSD